jgi:hypothetical protein
MVPAMRPPGAMTPADQMRLQQQQMQQQQMMQQQQQGAVGMRFMRPQGGPGTNMMMMRPPLHQQMGPQGGPVHR